MRRVLHDRSMSNSRSLTVVAILASPPTTSGARTIGMAQQAAELLGGRRLLVANLFDFPVADLPALSVCGSDAAGWLAARPRLVDALQEADLLLAAWGLHSLHGQARLLRAEQLSWLQGEAWTHGHVSAWCVGGQPRHPSRWHQYVSDRHGRTGGGSSSDRLRQVLGESPLQVLVQQAPLARPVTKQDVSRIKGPAPSRSDEYGSRSSAFPSSPSR